MLSALVLIGALVASGCSGSAADEDGARAGESEAPNPETPTDEAAASPCLTGTWWLSPDETTALYSTLLPGMPVTVTGTHWVEFTGDSVDYWAVLEVHFNAGSTNVTFGLDQHGSGGYAIEGDVLTMNYDSFESRTHAGHGQVIYDRTQEPASYADEAVAIEDNGNGTITIDRVTVPVIEMPPIAGGPMTCDGDTMTLGFTSGLADATAVFARLS